MVIDVWMASPTDRDWTTVIILAVMIFLSSLLRFIQEHKSLKATAALKEMVKNTATVKRLYTYQEEEIDISQLVPGDIVFLSAGDMIPADVRILESKDLFISQSSLTGESDAVEKMPYLQDNPRKTGSVTELDNICFMGSNVVSGSATALVIATGTSTYLGTIAKSLAG